MNQVLDELEVALLTPENLRTYMRWCGTAFNTEDNPEVVAALEIAAKYCDHAAVNYGGVDAYCAYCWTTIDDTRRA
jgi:hypothetical protein